MSLSPVLTAAAGAGLTAREQALFELLSSHQGRLFSRSDLLERVWGLEFGGDDRIVDVYVRRIRRKVGEDAIETVRGAGYRCPEHRAEAQAWPHAHHLSPDARTVLKLGRRVLGAGGVREVLAAVQSALEGAVQVAGVALLMARAQGTGEEAVWNAVDAVGELQLNWDALPTAASLSQPQYVSDWGANQSQPGRAVALLPLIGPQEIWGWLALAGPGGVVWDAAARAQLEAVAALVHPALRLRQEMALREATQRELRDLNAHLEQRAQQHSDELRRAQGHSEALALLSRRMETARSSTELLAISLPMLARLAGSDACAAHWLTAGTPSAPAPSAPALACARHDGTFCLAPPLPETDPGALGVRPTGNGWTVRHEIDGDTLVLHAFGVAGEQTVPSTSSAAPSPLLQSAAQSLALMLARQWHVAALERTALTDESTGLGNRQAFLADLHREVAFGTRHGGGFALSLIEIANIRYLNATAGYAGGNDAILALARLLIGVRRAEDRAYRLNGATFAVLLRFAPGETDLGADQEVQGWSGRFQHALDGLQGQAAPGRAGPLDLHVGQAIFPAGAASVSELLRAALDDLRPLALHTTVNGGRDAHHRR